MPNDITVEEMFNTTGLTVLRFYLSSKLKNPVTSTITSSDVQCTQKDLISIEHPFLLQETTYTDTTFLNTSNGDADFAGLCEDNIPVEGHLNSSVNVRIDVIIASGDESNSPLKKGTNLVIHRAFNELVASFLHLDKDCGPLTIEMVLPDGHVESGVDAGGVLRDCLCEFWTTFYERSTEGTLIQEVQDSYPVTQLQ